VGKDITRFHAIYWPAILFSLNLPLPKTLFVHGFITSGGQKMSKSLGNVIDPFELVEKYGQDPVRYYFLREIPSTEDGDFTYERFEERYNADLANGLGNSVARALTLARKCKMQNANLACRQAGLKMKIQNSKLNEAIKKTRDSSNKALEEFKFNEALEAIWSLISFCDGYIEKERPWRLLPSNSKSEVRNPKLKEILSNLLFALTNITQLLQPFLPATSEKILEQIESQEAIPLFPRLK
jgi:methionyl-tRNA synthetase